MSNLVYLGTPPPFIAIPTTTVESYGHDGPCCGSCDADEWAGYAYRGDGCCCAAHLRERTVPVSLDLGAPCPDCLGVGIMRAGKWVRSGAGDPTCPTCSGLGVVPTLWLAEPCERCNGSGVQGGYEGEALDCAGCDGRGHGPVVARRTVQPMPVGREWPRGQRPYIWVSTDERFPREVHMWDGTPNGYDGIHRARNVTDEPWAQGLVPGAWVLKVGERIDLDEPIVVGSLVPGLNTVELAR